MSKRTIGGVAASLFFLLAGHAATVHADQILSSSKRTKDGAVRYDLKQRTREGVPTSRGERLHIAIACASNTASIRLVYHAPEPVQKGATAVMAIRHESSFNRKKQKTKTELTAGGIAGYPPALEWKSIANANLPLPSVNELCNIGGASRPWSQADAENWQGLLRDVFKQYTQ